MEVNVNFNKIRFFTEIKDDLEYIYLVLSNKSIQYLFFTNVESQDKSKILNDICYYILLLKNNDILKINQAQALFNYLKNHISRAIQIDEDSIYSLQFFIAKMSNFMNFLKLKIKDGIHKLNCQKVEKYFEDIRRKVMEKPEKFLDLDFIQSFNENFQNLSHFIHPFIEEFSLSNKTYRTLTKQYTVYSKNFEITILNITQITRIFNTIKSLEQRIECYINKFKDEIIQDPIMTFFVKKSLYDFQTLTSPMELSVNGQNGDIK